ncbi:ATP-binding protein [Planotetraspora silvatica]|uniref:ATP-binding protein n=1 Tax=Planotetraspora silvatica TaxID=234614 RepID=A0A8J3XN70_9ACTN|nr:tetratricopeptide repeat protein [Planotetraspora silvatica]GII48217.1 ATP-binding protein [Planotetraspora silvatica]
MSGDIPALVGQAWPYVSAAITAYGAAVLAKAQDEAVDATVGWGRRILRRIFGAAEDDSGDAEPPRPLTALAADPDDGDLQAALRVEIRNALAADLVLAEEIRAMLAQAGSTTTTTVRASHGGVAAGRDITGPFTTGPNSPITITRIHTEVRPAGDVDGGETRPFELPRSAKFVGREDQLSRMADLLDAPGFADPAAAPVIRLVVQGMGGIGKSELVRVYGARHRDRYRLMWWITADGPDAITRGLAALAAALHPPIALVQDLAEQARWAAAWLRTHDRWLLAFDNVDDPGNVREWVDLLARPGGHIVITTRRDVYWPGAHVITLNVLSEEAAADLLMTVSGRTGPADAEHAAEIVRELGRLPVAVEQAAAFIRMERTTSLGRYLAGLHDHPEEHYRKREEGTTEQRTMARLWDAHLAALRRHDQDRGLGSEHLLRVLAHLAPDNVPWAVLVQPPVNDLDGSLRLLASYSMITRSGEDAAETVSTHRLFQSVIRTGLDYDDPRRRAARDDAVAAVLSAAPPYPDTDPGGWPAWRDLLLHIDALEAHHPPDTESENLSALLNMAALYAFTQGMVELGHRYARRALSIAEVVYGPDHPTLAVRLGNLAMSLYGLDRSAEAVPLFERALSITEAALGPDHPDVAIRLSNLAACFLALDRPDEAVPLFKRAMTITAAAQGLEHPIMATLLSNLASCYLRLDRPAEAVPLLELALEITEISLGPDHPTVATSLTNLASSFRALDRPAEAVPLDERALAVTEAAYGPHHPFMTTSLLNLAKSLHALDRSDEAIPLEEKALAITEAAHGPDHPDVAIRLGDLASSLLALDRPDEAMPLFERALAITEAAHGPDHPDVAISLGELAACQLALDRPAEAIPLFERALAITEAAHGPDHPDTVYLSEELRRLKPHD